VIVLVIVAAVAVAVVANRPRSTSRVEQSARSRSHGVAIPANVVLAATESASALPLRVSRSVAFADGSDVLVAGGIEPNQSTTAAVARVGAAGATTVSPLAVAVHDAAGAGIGQKDFVFGGGAQQVSDAVQVMTRGSNTELVGRLPRPRADFAAVVVDGTAYLVGGYDGSAPAPDVLATTDGITYRTVAQLPVDVRYPAVTASGRTIYVFGGEWAGVPSNAIQAIDTQTGRASVIGRLSAARTQASAFTLSGHVYVAGGLVGGAASFDILRFDAQLRRVDRAGTLPLPVADAAVTVTGATAHLAGGEGPGGPLSSLLDIHAVPETPQLAQALARPFAGHLLIADRGNNGLIVVNADKQVLWRYPSTSRPAPPGGFYFPDDAFFVDHGRSIVSNEEENHAIVRIAYPSGRLLWSYGHPGTPGSTTGYLNQPDDAFLLRDGTMTVADAKNCRVIFISAMGAPVSQIGTTGDCVHRPGRSLGYPNGDTPLADGNVLISEINGSWVSEYSRSGTLIWTVQLPLAYPSDPQQIGADLYLVADYSKPGGIVEFTREGQIVWSYRPTSGPGMLDHPSLAERLDNGLIGVNDDYRDRVALIDPSTGTIVWQYGVVDRPGTGPNEVNIPDGFDLLLPNRSTPGHSSTG
jgi:outer membrane protein assembly factor BamB